MATINDIVPGGVLTQGYGMTSYARQGAYGGGIHDGIDIAAPYGTRINWPLPPSRVRTGYEAAGYGYFTVGYHGPYEMLFGHQAQIGNTGYAGLIDSTGYSTGNHTHLRVKLNGVTIDPIPWLNAIGADMGVPQKQYDEAIASNQAAARKGRRHNIANQFRLYQGKNATAAQIDFWQDAEPDVFAKAMQEAKETKDFNPTGFGASKNGDFGQMEKFKQALLDFITNWKP